MRFRTAILSVIYIFVLGLSGCGGGGGGASAPTPIPVQHLVNISWAANREAAVNSAGGGYTVAINGQVPINVPFASGSLAPTTTTASLPAGNYTVTVTAYSALSPSGGTSGSTSLPSATFTFAVP